MNKIEPQTVRAEAIKNYPLPTTSTKLSSFLVCLMYEWPMMTDTTQYSKPLYDLVNDSSGKLKWSEANFKNFISLKNKWRRTTNHICQI